MTGTSRPARLASELLVRPEGVGTTRPTRSSLRHQAATPHRPHPSSETRSQGVRPQDAGVASAMVNTSQQVGGSIGTALLNTIAASATTGWIAAHATGAGTDPAEAAVHGYVTAFWWATAIMLLAALIVAVLVRTDDGRLTGSPTEDADEPGLPVLAH